MMNYKFTERLGKPSSEYLCLFDVEPDGNEVFYELLLGDKRYCFFNFCQMKVLQNDNLILINMWNKLVLFSSETGDLLYFSGLLDSFMDIVSIKNQLIVFTDSTLIKINKDNFYMTFFRHFPYTIQDYVLSETSKKITITFHEDEKNVIIDL